MSVGYFDRELITEEPEEPIIEPLEAERDDEILANQEVVTPEEGEDDIVGEDDVTSFLMKSLKKKSSLLLSKSYKQISGNL